MPNPDKFKESLRKFAVDEDTITMINKGYEEIVDKSPKKVKAEYFKRAVEIMNQRIERSKTQEILEYNACCKNGMREKASKAFAKANKELTIEEKIKKISEVQNMGKPILNEDNTITVHAVYYRENEKFLCACPNFNKVERDYPVSKDYCFCCGGHFIYHYEIMLVIKLEIEEIISSPLNSDGKDPCVFVFKIV